MTPCSGGPGRRCGRPGGSTTARQRAPSRSGTATTGSLWGSWSACRCWIGRCACRWPRDWSARTPSAAPGCGWPEGWSPRWPRALPGRRIHVVADAAYAGAELRKLPDQVSWTTRLRKDAALYELAPPRTGRRGRPRKKGTKLAKLADLARTATFTPTTAHRYGADRTVHTATLSCLWYTVFGPQPVTVVLIREAETSRGYDLALVTTQAHATAGQIVERYASRWAVEVAIQDAKQLAGVGQAHNRKTRAVERTVPFGLACLSLAICWYATTGHQPDDVTAHRAHRPWYRTKTNPSTADMLTKLRRVLIATRFRPTRPEQPTQAEIQTIRLAWEDPAA